MANLRQLKDIYSQDEALKMVAQSYSEIAANKLRRIRSSIERNRSFFADIAGLYHIVKTEALEKGILDRHKKNGTVSILLSSNHHFMGDVERKLLLLFVSHTPEFETNRIVIGKTGDDFLKKGGYNRKYSPIIFADDIPKRDELLQLAKMIAGYERIFVYFAKFRSVMTQDPNFVDLTGSIEPTPEKQHQSFYYIFEPEIEKMFLFFDRQIISLLMEQTFLEAELGRTAARLISMEKAQSNADVILKDDKRLISQARRSDANKQLLERILILANMNKMKVI